MKVRIIQEDEAPIVLNHATIRNVPSVYDNDDPRYVEPNQVLIEGDEGREELDLEDLVRVELEADDDERRK